MQKYLDDLSNETIRKDIIRACENFLEENEQEDEETKELILHEKMFNKLSINHA